MTKKDYQALAGALYAVNVDVAGFNDARPCEVLGFAIERIARVLAANNPRFDRERFIAACEDGNVTRTSGEAIAAFLAPNTQAAEEWS